MKFVLFTISFLLTLAHLNAQESRGITWSLYEGSIPNSRVLIQEKVDTREVGGRFISRISQPTLTYYEPKGESGKAVIICPGGGYHGVAIDHEGHEVAKIFQQHGIHAFVLKYRSPLDSSCLDKSIAPLQDAQQALLKAKDSLEAWGQENIQLGIMGFSAGGHLAATTSNKYSQDYVQGNNISAIRPDFSILIYPVITFLGPQTHQGSKTKLLGENPTENKVKEFSAELLVNGETPKVFLVHASDDKGVPVENSLLYYQACRDHEIPAEMHIYEQGGHGFGLNLPQSEEQWIDRLLHWLGTF